MAQSDPKELLKKAFLIGVGATAITIEKVQELANELVERGELSQKEAVSFTEDLKKRAVKEKAMLESWVKDLVDTYLKSAVKKSPKKSGAAKKKPATKAKPKATAKKKPAAKAKKVTAKKPAAKKAGTKLKSGATKKLAVKKSKPAAKKATKK